LSDEPPLRYRGLRLVQTVEDSKAINEIPGPCVIMSAAGMCNAGRIKHHLRNNIGRHDCTILFVGFQANGTLGRQILEGHSHVRIHGQMRRVNAQISHINGLSGHADRSGLLHWLSHFTSSPRHVFLTHGEEAAALHLADQIKDRWGWQVSIPHYRDVVKLE
jgi:metallo-beta-lactamase family protein